MPEPPARYQKPRVLERLFGRVLIALLRVGVVRGHFFVLEVRGRKSGRTIALPVDPLELNDRRYLVSARGETQWVRNARAAPQVVLARAFRRRRYTVREVPAPERPPLLKAYLDRFATEVQRFFPVPKGSPPEAFSALATQYPVFELTERDG
jgi:deazaflavin-dependent oxidoreductase (nitroreductase family)